MAIIAIDLGTSVSKAAVFEGRSLLGIAQCSYSWSTPFEGWAEQDAESVWARVDGIVRQALLKARSPSIKAVCVSVQGDAVIPIDIRGAAIGPAILGMDARSDAEAADLQERFGRGQLYAATGMPCEPLNAITKVFWLIRNRPDLLGRLWKFVHYEEFLLMKLSGIPALDFTMASRTMAFDPVKKDWVADILEFVGVRPAQLGNVCPSGAPVGFLHKQLAESWGISRNALVITGGHNQCISAVGAGVIEPDLACYSMGATEVIGTCFTTPNMSAAKLASNYPCYCHAVPDHYFTITLNQSGGLSLEWFYRTLTAAGSGSLSSEYGAFLEESLEKLRFEPSPVLFLPHIVGSGTPQRDHLSRASFVGMSVKTSRDDLFQAVVDALCFEARLNVETLEGLGTPIAELRAVGDGARSRRILQLKASVLNKPISTLRTPEASLLGAAMLAQVATGTYRDLSEAALDCVSLQSTIEPKRAVTEAYEDAYGRYRQLYGTLRDYYHHWREKRVTTILV